MDADITTISSRESYQDWKNFLLGGHGDPTFNKFYQTSRLQQPLAGYYRQFSSPPFAWITDLVLYGVICSISDMKAVSQLVNVQTIQIWNNIRTEEAFMDDNILEAWCYSAVSDGAFSQLMLLCIDEFP